MELTIREADVGDAPALADLTSQLGYPCAPSEAEACLKEVRTNGRDAILVAELPTGAVVGWIHLSFATSLSTGPFAVIVGLVVDAELRGQGIGKSLVGAAIHRARGFEVAKVRVRSKSTRHDAHRFYENFGFEERKEQKVFDLKI